MQATQILSVSSSHNCCSANEYAEFAARFNEKLRFDVTEEEIEEKLQEQEVEVNEEELEGDSGEEEDDDDFEFSFACNGTVSSPISADEIFSDGQIRPVFPLFNQDLLFAAGNDGYSKPSNDASASLRPPLKKLFVAERDPTTTTDFSFETEESDEIATGPYCEWSGKAVETSLLCKKSNSTGFSKRWRFRDFVRRSHSDGKDAFVFLNPPPMSTKPSEKVEKTEAPKEIKNTDAVKSTAGRKKKTASSAHEAHYVRNRALKAGDRRKSYLPYRQDLVGFFTTVNGMSRNVHPF